MPTEFCPRQIIFTIPGSPGVLVTATENAGSIDFKLDVQDSINSDGDLRALFFDINEAKLPGMTITGGDGFLTEYRIQANQVLDLDDGANLAGKTKTPFDVGLEWGTPGTKPDDINFEVGFTLSNAANDLTLDDIAGQRFGARLDSMGGKGGSQLSASKLLLEHAPAAPDAIDDSYTIFEDGVANANTPSKSPSGVSLLVLANDTDADGDPLSITALHDGPSHGSVAIAADGKSLVYTPVLDYSGPDSFEYCVSDGNGGQDHATVSINVSAVADDPVISWTVAQGVDINQILLTVTATQNDADGSETIDWLSAGVLGGLPAGVTVSPPINDPVGTPDHITQVFTVTTAAATDYDFNLDFTALAVENSNADTEANTASQHIQIEYTANQDTLDYIVTDQSIWNTGDAFVMNYDDFLGINDGVSATIGDDTVTGTFISGSASVTAGLDVHAHFEGGDIDANIPVDVTVNTTYNKTTDKIYVDPSLALGSGGSFVTHGPEGDFKLDFIFVVSASLQVSLLWVDLFNDGFSENLSQNIFDLNSADAAYSYPLLPGIVDIGFAWPHLSVTNDPGLLSGSGASNNFLSATLDVDQLANALLGGALSFIDPSPLDPGNFELLDLDVTGGLNFIQNFAIGLDSTSAALVLEDGASVPFTFGTPLTIDNASSHDSNNDGQVTFTIALDPNLTLDNETVLGGNISAELTIPKNFDLTLYHDTYDIASGPLVTVFDDTFALDGVGAMNFIGFA